MASTELQGKTVAFLVAQEGVEEAELTKPWQAVKDAGGTPELLAPKEGEIQAFNHLDKSSTYPVDKALGDADPDSYDALVLPGGVANPDQGYRAVRGSSPSAARPEPGLARRHLGRLSYATVAAR
jgi:protease I